jgi:hypothetical protein
MLLAAEHAPAAPAAAAIQRLPLALGLGAFALIALRLSLIHI